jgi:hypothetical protein
VFSPLGVFAADEFGAEDQGAPAAEAVFDADGAAASAADAAVPEEGDEFGDEEAVLTEGGSAESEAAYAVTPGDWNADRTQYLYNGQPVKGLFVAYKKSGGEGLYYADPSTGYVLGSTETYEGRVNVGSGPYYILNNSGIWQKTNTSHSYYLKNQSDPYMVETAGAYGGSTKYFVNDKGVVRTSKGIADDPNTGDRYYVQAGGKIKTSAGFVSHNSYTYYVQSGGKFRLTEGKFKDKNGKYHLIKGSKGCVVTKKGFSSYNGKRYYVNGDNHGALARSKTLTVTKSGKTRRYHIDKDCEVQKGKHTWNGHKCLANSYGVLYTKGIVKYDGKKYYVTNNYGKIAIKSKFTYNGNTYFASAKDGHLLTGVISWYDGKYYYCYDTCAMMTKAAVFEYNNKWYYNKSGGGLKTNDFVTSNYKHYYAGSNAAFKTTSFRYSGHTVNPDSRTGEISFKDWNAIHGNKWKYYQYIQVSISNQSLVYYLNGEKFTSCSIVSGMYGVHDTQKGTFKIQRKYTHQTGTMGDKTINFDYWMNYSTDSPINRLMTAADGPYWMKSYGGSVYKTNGSDGEILLPYSAATTLFNNVPVGTPIVIQ